MAPENETTTANADPRECAARKSGIARLRTRASGALAAARAPATGEARRHAIARRLREGALGLWVRWGLRLGGLFALLWFLVRVIPKPSRAAYPCQRAAFPAAAAFILWICGFFGMAASIRNVRAALARSRYKTALGFCLLGLICLGFSQSADGTRAHASYAPADPANTPLGEGKGIFPGRVVWAHNPDATTWDPSLDSSATLRYWDDDHTNQAVVDGMMSQALRRLAGADTDAAAWDAFFRYFNAQHGRGDAGYQAGQKIAIKVNHVEQRSHRGNSNNTGDTKNLADISPQVELALLKQLVNQAGVPANCITMGDPSRFIADKTYSRCAGAFPGVTFIEDNFSYPSNPVGTEGRTKSLKSPEPLIHYSGPDKDGSQIPSDYVPLAFYEADYLINLSVMKGHPQAAATMCGKNWYGSLCKPPYGPHHNLAFMAGTYQATSPTPEAGHYRSMVDLMGHEHLGGKTMLYLLDGLWGFQTHGTGTHPVKWQNVPFNNDYPSSLLASQDPVAIDSVALDFLRTEFADNMGGLGLEGAVDDYMHEAALANNAPSGTVYDPEQDGIPLRSLGVHEHWNNPVEKLYTRNLNEGAGIELVALAPAQIRAAGTVRIEVEPPDAPWSLRGPEGLAQDGAGSTTLSSAPTGRYVMIWQPLAGWRLPPDTAADDGVVTKTLDTDGEILFRGVYQQIPPPEVALTSPAPNSTWAQGAAIPLAADAFTQSGAITSVEFIADGGVSLGVVESAPYEMTWTNVPPGQHTIMARASSSEWLSNDSERVTITVGLTPRDCLFVAGPAVLAAGDLATIARLGTWGYNCIPVVAKNSTAADAAGKSLVFISESVNSTDVLAKFRDVAVPVLCSEDYNYDDMNMTGPTINTHYGYLTDQQDFVITDTSSPLSGGLPPGQTQIFTTIARAHWGTPNANATVGAHIVGDPAKAATFGYRGGAEMFNGFIAPARRTGFFLQSYTQEMTLLTPAGLALFDAAVRWTGGRETDEMPAAPGPLTAATEGAGAAAAIVLQWSAPVGNEDGFELERSVDGVNFALVSRFSADTHSVRENLAALSLPVYYRVRSYNGNGYSAYSNVVRVPEIPPAPDAWIAF